MNWLARLKKGSLREFATAAPATHWQESGGTVASVATDKKPAANDLAQAVGLVANPVPATLVTAEPAAMPNPDRWCWPHSSAMTGREIDTMIERTSLFNRRGLSALNAELLADKLVNRDRDGDVRRLCLECQHLSRASGAMRCAKWQRAGLGAPGVPAGLQTQLQRCSGFKDAP